jgi:hypothetical protein
VNIHFFSYILPQNKSPGENIGWCICCKGQVPILHHHDSSPEGHSTVIMFKKKKTLQKLIAHDGRYGALCTEYSPGIPSLPGTRIAARPWIPRAETIPQHASMGIPGPLFRPCHVKFCMYSMDKRAGFERRLSLGTRTSLVISSH